MNRRKWTLWGVTGAVCAVIVVVTVVVVTGILGAKSAPALEFEGFDEVQQRRIAQAVRKIVAMNDLEGVAFADGVLMDGGVNIYDGAVMREGSYEEVEIEGIYQAIFIMDLPAMEQSYRVNYYYLTEEQEGLFEYSSLASCLPVGELIYGDFDCRGDLQTVFMDKWHDIAERLSVEYGIPWEAVMAQGILESSSGTSRFAVERNNFFGIGAFDANPDNAFAYDSPEEGWRGYYENIVHVSTQVYCLNGAFTGENITDPYAYLATIKRAGYATDPNYVALTAEIVDDVLARAEKKGWATSAELATQYPEMVGNAGRYASTCW